MGFGVGFGVGPVRVGAGISSRSVGQGCLPLVVVAALVWIVRAVLYALYAFFSWPITLVEPLGRKIGLNEVHQAGVNWASVALWAEFVIAIIGMFFSAPGIRDLFFGAPGTKLSARFWRFWAVALFPVVTAATIGMALASRPAPVTAGPVAEIAGPSSGSVEVPRPPGVPESAQQVIVMGISREGVLRVRATASGPVLPSADPTAVRLIGIKLPRENECKVEWAERLLMSYLPKDSNVWIARGGGAQRADEPLAVYLWREGKDRATLNARLLLNGSAHAVTSEVRGEMRDKFERYESRAREARRGIHGCPV